MMMLKSYAECATVLPDDHVWEDQRVVVFGGRLAAEAIAEILRNHGYDVSSPECMDEHGWDLNVRISGKRIWLEIQGDSGCFILQVEAMVGIFVRKRDLDLSYYAAFLTKLNEGLRHDPRFLKVEWYALDARQSPTGDPADDPLSVA
ncbi:hypothetical protein [Phenylobacterium sp.]|uniref:hypothetical protein n=1 Tax=Phenylobacterium sp. TaxID=1871053 RepID=UPI0025F8B293|nr:hypothetical protein [Phenylobacterium sp.]